MSKRSSRKRAKDADRARRYRERKKERDASRSVTRDASQESGVAPNGSPEIPDPDASRSVTRDASRSDVPHLEPSDPALSAMALRVRKAWASRVEKLGNGLWADPMNPAAYDVARWVLSLPEKTRLATAARALDAYFADDFARKAGFPIRMFAKNPQKYLLGAPPEKPPISKDAEWLTTWKEERRPWN